MKTECAVKLAFKKVSEKEYNDYLRNYKKTHLLHNITRHFDDNKEIVQDFSRISGRYGKETEEYFRESLIAVYLSYRNYSDNGFYILEENLK